MQNQFNFRQQQILDIARQSGRVTVEDLAARFDVTPQTIRKDLNDLGVARVWPAPRRVTALRRRERRLWRTARPAQVEKEGIGRLAGRRPPTTHPSSSISARPPRRWRAISSVTRASW